MVSQSRFLSSISCRFKTVKQKVSILNKVTSVDGMFLFKIPVYEKQHKFAVIKIKSYVSKNKIIFFNSKVTKNRPSDRAIFFTSSSHWRKHRGSNIKF